MHDCCQFRFVSARHPQPQTYTKNILHAYPVLVSPSKQLPELSARRERCLFRSASACHSQPLLQSCHVRVSWQQFPELGSRHDCRLYRGVSA